jgi:K+/H+ antiporter YhaU regulatory subunit KhtT
MRKNLPFTAALLLAFLLMLPVSKAKAQTFANGGEYMNFIAGQYHQITDDFLSYTSAVAHGKNARKIDARRKNLLTTVSTARRNVARMPPYKGDKSLRDSVGAFLKISYNILNEDYGKIVNLEEVAEQSYDGMEAYFLAQEIADKKLTEANYRLHGTEKAFAGKNGVDLVEKDDDLSKKILKANQVGDYNRKIYLIFFKNYKQEMYLLDAMQKKDLNAIEQNRNTLAKVSNEGATKLNAIQPFLNDGSLLASCRQVLAFHKEEAAQIPSLTGFYLKEAEFNKIKKSFDTTKPAERTQEDVDTYNAAINDLNTASVSFNKTNATLAASRTKAIENYNKTAKTFLDKHTPHHR